MSLLPASAPRRPRLPGARSGARRRASAALGLALLAQGALADGVLTIGRSEDSTTFDPIATAQNVDFWVYMNVYDVLVRVDRSGTRLEPGLAERWEISDDGLTYTLHLREARFSDGSPITSADAAFSLTRLRDSEKSLWSDPFRVVESFATPDERTLVITLESPSVPFLSFLALPPASIVSKAGMESMGEDAYAERPIASGAFVVADWARGERVTLERNPEFWEAGRVSLDGVEWVSVPNDNTRMLQIQAGELDAVLFVPFSRVAQLEADPNVNMLLEPSSREDHLLVNHRNEALAKADVRVALDHAIDKRAIIDAVTFGIAEEAYSYIPKGALYHYADNLRRPYDPEKAKALLAAAGEEDLTLEHVTSAGSEVDEQIAVLLQQQLAQVGVTLNIVKLDPSQTWDTLVAGDYDLSVNYWTNDIVDPDQKTTFVLGHDANDNYMTHYENETVRKMVADARLETDPAKREAMYVELQRIAKEDVNWIDLYYSPYRNATRTNVENFYQNPLGRFFLEDTVKN